MSALPGSPIAQAQTQLPWLVPATSLGLRRLGLLPALLGGPVAVGFWPGPGRWIGWGRKPSARIAARWAAWGGGQAVQLEDGFLRSLGTGRTHPPLSIVIDPVGIYYDSTRPSALEQLLQSGDDLVGESAAELQRARQTIVARHLSKYNHAPDWSGPPSPAPGVPGRRNVLVIDQTAGDLSVELGGADARTFEHMLQAALDENPEAIVWVKTHPEVSAGQKRGYLTGVTPSERIQLLTEPWSPQSLFVHMDRVYAVSSTMGFEALLAGVPVSCFGLPWYAGWGVTDDRLRCARRTLHRTVDELFAAAYVHYSRYLDPVTRSAGTLFDVIDWLVRQREALLRWPMHGQPVRRGRVIGVGYRRWKQANVSPLLGVSPAQWAFVPDVDAARALAPQPQDQLLVWGGRPPAALQQLATDSGCELWRMEDGFLRSVGLGSDLIRPHSLVLDRRGIYFDPSQPSDLELLLATADFSAEELATAARVRELIKRHGLTKYNLEPREPVDWPSTGRRVVLVPGQVEDDASILLGCTEVRTNADLLRAARRAAPDAFIVYKPHPDVMSGNRRGALEATRHLADQVETRLSVISCIEACDEVHTMTSLTGFDALLRNKRVFTYGVPFYSGWGLTQDRAHGVPALARRKRRLSLDELVAGTLLRYPIYWDWELRGYTTCEAVLMTLVRIRTDLELSGGLERLRSGFVRRQWRKLVILTANWKGASA
ncbi:MAG: hypothetical protein RL722_1898 [Pseudomonadota bacterium]|jgi:capsular polysaccharide export protein